MNLNRNVALKIHWIFDQLIPPLLRDCKWFMYLPIKLAFRHKAKYYFDFKQKAHLLNKVEYDKIYLQVSEVMFERATDLNRESIELIKAHIQGKKIVEIGCGKGYLANILSENYDITAVDIHIAKDIKQNIKIKYVESDVEKLPFADNEFDTVICTHTLEHVLYLQKSINELRRIGKYLIVVVPRQRPYKYTFDLHINFFPYDFSFLNIMKPRAGSYKCVDAGGDIFYFEMTPR